MLGLIISIVIILIPVGMLLIWDSEEPPTKGGKND